MKVKKILKIALWSIAVPLLTITLYLFMALVLSLWSTSPVSVQGDKEWEVYVHSNGVHLDIALAKELLDPALLAQLEDADKARYMSFGWGDKGFYLETPEWSDLKASVAFRAMCMPSATAMHVTRYTHVKSDWINIPVTTEQLQLLNKHISESFMRSPQGRIMPIANSGYYENDHFYEANGAYHLLNTCNIWVNKALKKMQVKTSVWSPFDKGVLYHLQP